MIPLLEFYETMPTKIKRKKSDYQKKAKISIKWLNKPLHSLDLIIKLAHNPQQHDHVSPNIKWITIMKAKLQKKNWKMDDWCEQTSCI